MNGRWAVSAIPKYTGTHLGEVHAEGVHVEAVEEAGEALTEAGQALVHDLKMHQVGLEVGHGVGQLGEGGLEGVEREGRLAASAGLGRLAEGGAR